MSKLSLSAIALATSLAGGAFAETADFTGYSIGGSIGYGDFVSNDGSSFSGDDIEGDTQAATLGLQVGYNYALQNDWIIGAQLGVQFLGDVDNDGFSQKNAFEIDDTEIFNVRGIVGKAFTPDIFAYAAVGYESWEVDYTEFNSSGPDIPGSERLTGASIGIGAEYLLFDHQTIGAEVKYTEFESSESYGFDANSIAPDITQLIVSYNYRF
ncbi:outer membrane protein [Yoonia tamlensis]|nr:outer membrane beta-barrel protein [Yoonia tamlensis]